jgi:hypothetical protein
LGKAAGKIADRGEQTNVLFSIEIVEIQNERNVLLSGNDESVALW